MTDLAVDCNNTRMVFNNAISRCQPQASPAVLFFGSEKGVKNPLKDLLVHTDTVVRDRDLNIAARFR